MVEPKKNTTQTKKNKLKIISQRTTTKIGNKYYKNKSNIMKHTKNKKENMINNEEKRNGKK